MELQLIKLMFYVFAATTGALFVYITAIAVFFIRHIRAERYMKD